VVANNKGPLQLQLQQHVEKHDSTVRLVVQFIYYTSINPIEKEGKKRRRRKAFSLQHLPCCSALQRWRVLQPAVLLAGLTPALQQMQSAWRHEQACTQGEQQQQQLVVG
jgi:hypothetical protein